MLISVDGRAAAGKTTMSHMLAEVFGGRRLAHSYCNLQPFWELLLEQVPREASQLRSDLGFFRAIVRLRHDIGPDAPREIEVSDEFWWALWSKGRDERYFDLFRKHVRFPQLSFYLEISAEASSERWVARRQKRGRVDREAEAKVLEAGKSKAMRKDKKAREFWQWLEGKFPHLYIIDASRPEADVAAELVEITAEYLKAPGPVAACLSRYNRRNF